MNFIGIDPGATGGFAVVGPQGGLKCAGLTPSAGGFVDAHALAGQISDWIAYLNGDVVAMIEQVHAMPKQGVTSTFKFGTSFGTAIGILAALKVPMDRVTPQTWKKSFALNGKPKDASRLKACELWPERAAETFKLKKSVDAAEAALIAEHARRTR